MKILDFLKILFLFLLSSGILQAQTVIYSEDFNDDIGKGFDGNDLNDIVGVNWTLNVDDCSFNGVGDYVKVVATGNDRLEAKDCDGEVIWRSPVIDISSHTDINISFFTAETGTGSNANNKYINLYYILDDGSEISFFESTVNWGTATASISKLDGNSLQLVARMKTTYASDKIYIDDVFVSGSRVVASKDALTQVIEPVSQVPSQNLSSIANNLNSAQALLKFILSEPSSADDLDTKVSSIKFLNIAQENKTDLASQFAGFALHDGLNFIQTSSVVINTNEIILNFADGDFNLPDDSSQEYELRAYLNPSGIIDGQKVKLQLDSNFTAYESGSGFDYSNSHSVTSSEHQISVEATTLSFVSIPTSDVIKNSDFSVSLKAIDKNGNSDLDAYQAVELSVITPKGVLSGNLIKNLNNGSLVFNDLSYDYPEQIKLLATGDGLLSAESAEISIIPLKSIDTKVLDWFPTDQSISSLAVTEDVSQEVLRFQIIDTLKDQETGILKTIRLVSGDKNTMDWQKDIGDFQLHINGEKVDVNFIRNASSLTIDFTATKEQVEIPDGEFIDLSLFFYLNEKSNDGAVFQASIEKTHAMWEVEGVELIEEFSDNLLGPIFMIDVQGTELTFTNKPPKVIVPNEPFGLGLRAIDKFGNRDLNSAVDACVSLASGIGELTSVSGLSDSLIDGEFLWDDLMYNASENFTILIEADGMLSVLTDNISSLDANSLIVPSNSPIQSKVLSAMATNSDHSEVIFKFLIKDFGTLDDSPTILNSMKFYNKLLGKGLDWKKHLAACTLLREGEVIAKTTKIEDEYISFTSLDVEVANASQSEFELGVCFKRSSLPDKAQIQVEIRNEHAWKASSTATNLLDILTDDIASSIHVLDVSADRFSFISIPIGIGTSETFSLEIAAVDEHQNIDVDNNSSVNLNLVSGEGKLSHSGMLGPLSNGMLSLKDVSYSGTDLFELSASGDLQTCTESIFVQEENLIFADDFESTELSNWENISDWKVSTYLPVKGHSSLKHNLTNAIGNSHIFCPLSEIPIGSESIFWEFTIKNSVWDPSSSNYFLFHLLMDSHDPDMANELFSVGVNLKGTDDLLSLWKTQNGGIEPLLKSDFDWNENDIVTVKVEYTAKGEWKLYYNRLGEKKNWLSAGTVMSEVVGDIKKRYSALAFNFKTASRAGQLWFDDLKMTSYNTVPFLKSHAIFSDSIVLNFSEDLLLLESSKLANFHLKFAGIDLPIKEVKLGSGHDQLILYTENELQTGKYHLCISGLSDLHEAISEPDEIVFDFFAEAKVHDLIINEILADESPVVSLPEYEFIEIYNRSDYPINIKNYKLRVGNAEKTLPDFEIQAHAYLILCSHAASEFYQEFGNTLGLSSFSSLTNSGTRIALESSSGILLDEVSYSSDWYADDEKKSGGWSLERIDVSNFCSTASNWSVSESPEGGTPGNENSIKGICEDKIAPELISYLLLSNQELQVEFSESVNEAAALLLSNYTIEGIAISSVTKVSDKIFKLYFASAFQDGDIQKLSMNNLTDECGNFHEISVDFVWHDIHVYDLVINEILADESPVIGLPEYEFIEIYNRSDYPINVKDYKLKVGNIEKILSDFEIQAHDYQILCSHAASEFYQEFGNTLGLSSFPSLTNSGTRIALESSSGVLLDEVNYSSDWYVDEEKNNGGWSLERIDVTNHSWQAENWRASVDEKGGTPGKQNSIEAYNPDLYSPRLLRFDISNSNSIDVFFSETLARSQAFDIKNYSINNAAINPISIEEIDSDNFALRLIFASDFETNVLYELCFSDVLVDLAGNSIEDRTFEFSLADMPQEGDIVINEVLFNPYPDGADYVELLNISNRMIDIRDLFIANRDQNFQLDVVYSLSNETRMLESGSYLLLSIDTLNIKENYSYADENVFMQINKMPSYNDDVGRVVILNRNNEQLDDFAYNEKMHFQGLTSTEGVSLERINPNRETNLSSNWISAAQSMGFGTPGLKNSCFDIDETVVNEIGFKSKTFSPDNDGVDDRLIINIDLGNSGYVANIRIYNSIGNEVFRLASNLTLSTKDVLFWDGLLANKERAPIGIYVLYFELHHPDGEVKTYKKTCVLSGKFR